MKKAFCTNCGNKLIDGAMFCDSCGMRLEPAEGVCSMCGHNLLDGAMFCDNCGAKVIKVEPKIEEKKEEKETKVKDGNKKSVLRGKKIKGYENGNLMTLEEPPVENPTITPVFDPAPTMTFNEVKEEVKKEEPDLKVLKNTPVKEDKNEKNNMASIIVVCAILFVISILISICLFNYALKNQNKCETVGSTINKHVEIEDSGIADAVEKVYDSVVVVKTYVNGKLYSTGTGFVYDKEGYILTNNHVIESGTEIHVVFTNNKEITATVVGKDSYSDIGVLKVNASNVISVAEIGSSNEMRVGDTTFAVGAPLDYSVYSWSVTRGILSGKNRLVEINSSQSYYSNSSTFVMSVLQTDTAINSGNSGGPLCNANGEVIGITNMKIASSSVEGISFAIPIEKAKEIAATLRKEGKVTRPYLGVSMYDLSSSMFSTGEDGVYISSVENGSPADKAGLMKGDVITSIDNVDVSSSAYLRYELYKHKVGDKITIEYTRAGRTLKTTVTLGSSK